MTDHLDKVSESLASKNIRHDCYRDCIHIPLPKDFGTLEVKFWSGGDDSIELLEGDFHTHSEVLAEDLGTSRHDAVSKLMENIMSGSFLLIIEREPGKAPRKIIEETLDKYLKYLPDGTTYEIANET